MTSPGLAPSRYRPDDRSRGRRLTAPMLTGAAIAGLTLALHVRDPHQQGSWGICPTKFLTGWDCPGCGGLRAVHDLTDLDVSAALSSNILVVLAVPLLVLLWLGWLRRAWRGQGAPYQVSRIHLALGQAAVVVMVVFAVVRNTPWGSWLAA